MTYDLDLQSQPILGQGRPSCQKSRSKVKRFSQESAHKQTDKRTDGQTDGQTDGRYQVHYLPSFAVDNKGTTREAASTLIHFHLLETGDCGDYRYWNGTCFKLYEKPELKFEDAVQVCEDQGGKIITTGEYQGKTNFIGGEHYYNINDVLHRSQGVRRPIYLTEAALTWPVFIQCS